MTRYDSVMRLGKCKYRPAPPHHRTTAPPHHLHLRRNQPPQNIFQSEQIPRQCIAQMHSGQRLY